MSGYLESLSLLSYFFLPLRITFVILVFFPFPSLCTFPERLAASARRVLPMVTRCCQKVCKRALQFIEENVDRQSSDPEVHESRSVQIAGSSGAGLKEGTSQGPTRNDLLQQKCLCTRIETTQTEAAFAAPPRDQES